MAVSAASPLIPADGEAGERKGDELGIVERKDRQHQHRQIKKGQIGEGIEAQGFHRAAFAAARAAATNSPAITATIAMPISDRAAPSGQLPAPTNCTSIRLAIIAPLGPPTSSGVT